MGNFCWTRLLILYITSILSNADLGTGNNNKITWSLSEKQDMIDIIETVYRGAKKGRGLVSAEFRGTDVRKSYTPIPIPITGC